MCSEHFHHTCVHITMGHRHLLTAAPCSRLTGKSHLTRLPLHCSCASHGTVLNASGNLDGSGAWSPTTASENVLCLSRPCAGVLVFSRHGSPAGTVGRTRGKKRREGAVEASSCSTSNPQQVLLPSVIDARLLKQPTAFDKDRTRNSKKNTQIRNCSRTWCGHRKGEGTQICDMHHTVSHKKRDTLYKSLQLTAGGLQGPPLS